MSIYAPPLKHSFNRNDHFAPLREHFLDEFLVPRGLLITVSRVDRAELCHRHGVFHQSDRVTSGFQAHPGRRLRELHRSRHRSDNEPHRVPHVPEAKYAVAWRQVPLVRRRR